MAHPRDRSSAQTLVVFVFPQPDTRNLDAGIPAAKTADQIEVSVFMRLAAVFCLFRPFHLIYVRFHLLSTIYSGAIATEDDTRMTGALRLI